MIRMAWKRIMHRKLSSITFLFAFVCLFVLIPFGIDKSQETKVAVNDTIQSEGRGTYDLLVRPPSSRTDIEKQRGMVEENYIGDSSGGITIEDWQQLKEDEAIEVAAPVASLGYFRGQQKSVEFPSLEKPTRFSWEFYTSDGKNLYPISEQKSLTYLEKINAGMTQYIDDPLSESSNAVMMKAIMPENYYQLVAIDVESEHALTGLDYSDLDEEPKSETLDAMKESFGDPPIVKVLQREDLKVPLHMKLKVETLDTDVEKYLELAGVEETYWLEMLNSESPETLEKIRNELAEESVVKTEHHELNLSPFQQPFDGTPLILDEAFQPSFSERYAANVDTAVYYTASKIDYKNLDSTIPEVDIVEEGKPPSYKQVEKKGVSILEGKDLPFITFQMGTFTPLNESGDALAASPLGIYGSPEVKDSTGNTLTPTTIPGSFIPAPASGLTTLDSAALVKGDKPIDAIRVRVAGIDSYNEAAQQKIDQVATKLLKQGYEVDVVAGASFKEMTLKVEGMGEVIEPWTTLGVAQSLTESWNLVTLSSIVLFIIFSVVWLIVRLMFERNILAEENQLLYTIGWSNQKIKLRNFVEHGILISVSLGLAMVVLATMNSKFSVYLYGGILGVLALLISIYTLNKKQRKPRRVEGYERFASIFYYRSLIFPAMAVLLIATVLIMIQIASIGDSLQQSSITTLGDYVAEQSMVLQVMILIATIILATVSISESMNTLISERKSEFQMYHTIGWQRNRIVGHFSKEVMVWASIPLLLGIIIGIGLLLFFQLSLSWILIGIGVSIGLAVIMIGMLVLTRRY